MEICFTINGVLHCISIPILWRRFIWPPEWKKDWLRGDDIQPEIANDLAVLAHINVLVNTLETQGLQKHFKQSLHDAVLQLDLSKEMSINFDHQQEVQQFDCRA